MYMYAHTVCVKTQFHLLGQQDLLHDSSYLLMPIQDKPPHE